MTNQKAKNRSTVLAGAMVVALLVSVCAYADTYNLYFDKPKKGGKGPVVESESNEDSEQAVEKPQETKKPQSTDQVIRENGSDRPIVIHNINNNNLGPAAEAPSTSGALTATGSPPATAPRLRFGPFAMLLFPAKKYQSTYKYDDGYTYTYGSTKFGVGLNVGYLMSGVLGLNFYGMFHDPMDYDYNKIRVGAEFELYPFQGAEVTHRPVELAFLLGGNNILVAEDNLLSVYIGARAHLAFTNWFGFQMSVRANGGYTLGDAGFTFRI